MRFGIKTVPMHCSYDEVLGLWEEADGIEVIEDAWLWDHLVPLVGPPSGPVLEGWTLLAALAARTTRMCAKPMAEGASVAKVVPLQSGAAAWALQLQRRRCSPSACRCSCRAA